MRVCAILISAVLLGSLMGVLRAMAEGSAVDVISTSAPSESPVPSLRGGRGVEMKPVKAWTAPELIVPPDLFDYLSPTDAWGLAAEVNYWANERHLPVRLVWKVIYEESWPHYHHINPRTGLVIKSYCGALGLCQVLPDGMPIKQKYDLKKRSDNIQCMTEMYAYALHTRKYSLEEALGWYNSGNPNFRSDYVWTIARGYRKWAREAGEDPL